MKKILCVILSLILPIQIPLFSVYAADTPVYTYEDGSYIITEITDTQQRESTNILLRLFDFLRRLISFFTGSRTVSKTKYAYYYDINGVLLWSVYLTAEFSYNGKVSVCRSVSEGCQMYDTDWRILSENSGSDGSTAYADFTVRQSKLGVQLKTVTPHIELTCDCNGNIK